MESRWTSFHPSPLASAEANKERRYMDRALNADVSASATQEEGRPNAQAAVPEEDLTGKTLGDFRVLRLIGQGGMGQVYLAEQISLKRNVALKILKPELAAKEKSLKRFKAEAESVARATHSNIVQIYAIDEKEGKHFMALEYVEGRTLREYLEKKGCPDLLLGLSIMRQVAAALQRASELGIIHRDIKPENILLTRKGEVKVTDFGLVRAFGDSVQPLNLTQTGVTMGTPLYMSPEQVEGKIELDHRTDIYSFGVTCYHMFAGHPPFRGTSPFEVAVQHVQKEAQPLTDIRPDLPLDLCAMIRKMMAKSPDQRYQTAREIVRDVSRLRDTLVGASQYLGNSGMNIAAAAQSDAHDALSTQNFPPIPRPTWVPRLILAVLIVAGCLAGLGIGIALNRRPASQPSPPGAHVDEPEGSFAKAQAIQKEREKELVKLVQEHTKPDNFLDVATGLNFSIQLGVLYLKERRLEEAEKLFKDLEADKQNPPYRNLGRLGKAIVLAFRDQPDESNKLFMMLLEKEKGGKLPANVNQAWRNNPPLREMMARALNHNYLNKPAVFPPELEQFRHPPPPTIRMPTAGK